MKQKRSYSRLGRKLNEARRAARMTQSQAAQSAAASERSLWQAEAGRGRVDLFVRFASVLGLEVAGRSLPPGDNLGVRLLALRKRTGTSRRSLAAVAETSPATIAALESGRLGHLAVVERIGEALGAGLTLVRRGEAAGFYTMASASSAWDAWATPADLLESLYGVVGGCFDLDPCSPGRGRSRVRARAHICEDEDGLKARWFGQVFMNPPYGRDIGLWTAKALAEATAGHATCVLGLLPARTDTRWWHRDLAGSAEVWMLPGRLSFGDGNQPAPFPSAVAVWGATNELTMRMAGVFPGAWHVRRSP